MGFYSFTFAKTGLPIMAGEAISEDRFTRVKVLYANGDVITGTYDGYGRVDGENVGEDLSGFQIKDKSKDPKMVLTAYHQGEPFEALGLSKSDPAQGHFIETDFVHGMHALQEGQPGFDGHRYTEYRAQLNALSALVFAFETHRVGLEPSAIDALWRPLENMDFIPPANHAHELAELDRLWLEKVTPRLSTLTGLDTLPNDSPLREGAPVEAVRTVISQRDRLMKACCQEVLAAWGEARPVRTPDCDGFLKGGDLWLDEPLPNLQRKIRP